MLLAIALVCTRLLCYYRRAFARGLAEWPHAVVAPVGPPATISREPGQARKGAATAADLGAGVWLAGVASKFPHILIASLVREADAKRENMLSLLLTFRTQNPTKSGNQ